MSNKIIKLVSIAMMLLGVLYLASCEKKEKEVAVTGVSVSPASATIQPGETVSLKATVSPDNATNKSVSWSTSDNEVASVSNGAVTGKKEGSATITATAGGKSASSKITVKASDIAVTSITLDKSDESLHIGESLTITATVSPDNATNKTVTWSSSNADVASVTNGVVSAKAEGVSTITAKAGGKSATCKVTVAPNVIPVESIILDKTSANLKVKQTVTLKATVSPDNATNKAVTWISSNEEVATVIGGIVTAKALGTATITAKAGDKTATCAVTVEETPVESVTLDRTSASIIVNQSITLKATVNPSDATDKTVTWSTSDATVATVSNGVVTAKTIGSATITAKAGGKTATCTITVTPKPVESVTLDRNEAILKINQTITLKATVYPDDAGDKTVTWTSSDASVATVSNGVVTAKKSGTSTITAKAGDKTATCLVTVTDNYIDVTSISLNTTSASLMVNQTVTLTATVKPDNASDKTVEWKTSDASIASVSDGVVTAHKLGSATITAKAGDKTATCTVTVIPTPVSSISLERTAIGIFVDQEIKLTVRITPLDATDKTVEWTSDNPAVATVANGVVKGIKGGKCTVTVTAKGGLKATCSVTVQDDGLNTGIGEWGGGGNHEGEAD